MDVIGGLTAARLAFDLAKDLQGIDRSVDEAAFKLKLAELTAALADTQIALADAKLRISDLEAEIAGRKTGALCPVCKQGHLQVTKVEATWTGEFHTSRCDAEDCDYTNSRFFDTALNEYRSQHK